MCNLSLGNKISSDHQNNMVVSSMNGNIILDCQIKTHNGWVVRVKLSQETHEKREQTAMAPLKKNINNLQVELGHPSKSITHATAKALDIEITSTFKPYEDCTLGKAKQQAVSKKAVPHSKILGERLFFDISSPSTPTFGSMKHWLLVIDNNSDFIWSFFLKEKSDLVNIMICLIKI